MLTKDDLDTLVEIIKKCDTKDQLSIVYKLYKARAGLLSELKAATLMPGDIVKFTGRRGIVIKGKVKKVNRKTATVIADSGEGWRVSVNLLEHVH